MCRLLIFLATTALVLGLASPAGAVAPTWLEGQVIEPTAQSSISGLSCPTVTTCLAAAENTPVVQDDAPSFEPNTNPDPSAALKAVSCAPGTDFCMFVDNSGGAFTYSNGSFASLATVVGGSVGLDSVSCPTAGFCMAIDHNHEVFKYAGGAWDGGTTLAVPGADSYSFFVNISCASSVFCVALVSTDAGELYYTWDGSAWSMASAPFDVSGGHTISLSCTSTVFCLETDESGYASVFNGSGWSTPQQVDNPQGIAYPVLYSACAGTSCVAVDTYDNFIHTSDGQTWTSAVNIGAQTGMTARGIESVACATATLCVAGDGEGDATTYSVPPNPGKPKLSGTPTVSQTLALTHASAQNPPVWYYDDWFRCQNPGSTCSIDPISRSTSSYQLVAGDAGQYIEARETIGFGLDEEGYLGGGDLVSNIVGPIGSGNGTAKLVPGSISTTGTGVVTLGLHCTGGPCKGSVKLIYRNHNIGSAAYSIAPGQTAKIKLKLTTYGLNQLKSNGGRLTVKLLIVPAHGTTTTLTVTLKS